MTEQNLPELRFFSFIIPIILRCSLGRTSKKHTKKWRQTRTPGKSSSESIRRLRSRVSFPDRLPTALCYCSLIHNAFLNLLEVCSWLSPIGAKGSATELPPSLHPFSSLVSLSEAALEPHNVSNHAQKEIRESPERSFRGVHFAGYRKGSKISILRLFPFPFYARYSNAELKI